MKSDKVNAALAKYEAGYNCAQSVVSAFAQDFGLETATATKLSSCFGGGMRMGATCGALSGALMVLGLAKGFATYNPASKEAVEAVCVDFIARWREHIGDTECREILGLDVSIPEERLKGKEDGIFARFCPNCIQRSVELLSEMLSQIEER